jgi:hypothetical protein
MRKYIYIISFLCCLALVCNCNKSRPEDAVDFKYNITISETLDVPTWNSLFDSVSYIALKTDENTIMGQIEQIVVKDNLIYALANGIYCFDMEGYPKFKIANRGRARNEFIDATSFSVSDGKVYLYDKMKHKILVYDSQTGKYIEDTDTPIGGRRVYSIDDYFILDDVQSDMRKYTRFKVYSKKKPDREKAGYFTDIEHAGSIAGTCSWTNDGMLYSSFLRNLSWKINGTECIPYVKVIVPERKRLSDKTIKNMITDKTISEVGYNTSNAIYGLSYLAECDGFITGRLSDSDTFLFFIYDKETGNSRVFSSLVQPAAWQYLPVGEGTTGDSDCIYNFVPSESVLMMKAILGGVGKEPDEEKFRQAYNVVNSVKKDDNPIIARFWIKRL